MSDNLLRLALRGFVALVIFVALMTSIAAACMYAGIRLSNAISPVIPPDVESVAPLAMNPFPILGALVIGVIFGGAIGGFCAWEFLGWAKMRSSIRERLT